jgi:hypothetical protein
MRDAGAKLAVEFRDQAVVRGLLPDAAPAAAAGVATPVGEESGGDKSTPATPAQSIAPAQAPTTTSPGPSTTTSLQPLPLKR